VLVGILPVDVPGIVSQILGKIYVTDFLAKTVAPEKCQGSVVF
jgi:hypothetical protein